MQNAPKVITSRLTPAEYEAFASACKTKGRMSHSATIRQLIYDFINSCNVKIAEPKPAPRKFTHMAPRNAPGAIVGNLLGEDVHNRVQAGETLSEVLESYDVHADFVKGTYERQLARIQEEAESERHRLYMQEKYKRHGGGVVVDEPDEEDIAAQLDHLFDDDDVVTDPNPSPDE